MVRIFFASRPLLEHDLIVTAQARTFPRNPFSASLPPRMGDLHLGHAYGATR